MANVYRLDRGELQKPTKMSNGWMRIDGRITRTGVFTYRLPGGKVRRELRLPDEVFKTDAMQSFALVPVTDEHPPAMLDANNTKDYARGSVAGTLRKDGEFVAGELLITDAALIKKLEDGKAREISCGYNCDLDETPGVTSDGLRYDAIQRNIRGNHVAIVPKGRAGPEARVRMDGAGVEVLDGDDDQPRDEDGKWSSGGGGGGGGKSKPGATLKSPRPIAKKPSAMAAKGTPEHAAFNRNLSDHITQLETDMADDRVAAKERMNSGAEREGQAYERAAEEKARRIAVAKIALSGKDGMVNGQVMSAGQARQEAERHMGKSGGNEAKFATKPEAPKSGATVAAGIREGRAVAGLRTPRAAPARASPEAVAEKTKVELDAHEKETAATFSKLRQLEKWGTGKPEHDAAEISSLKRKLNDQEMYGKTLRDRLQVARSQISGSLAMNPRVRGSDS